MDASQIEFSHRVKDIQYIPHHRCPRCKAAARTTESGAWIRPYQDWFGTALSYWQDHLGYVYFQCDCQHHPEFRGSLRVARLGDAILPVCFVDAATARQASREPALLNAERVQQTVAFLAVHADPAFTAGIDWLTHTLYALVAGGLSPEAARRELQAWVERQVQVALEPSQVSLSLTELVDLQRME